MQFNNTEVFNFEGAIRGMRNPLESWKKSDSYWRRLNPYETIDLEYVEGKPAAEYVIGENDLTLMKKLRSAGSDHSKFLRQILVSVDITAPLYWYKEFDTYKIGTVANSTSTMHKLTSTPITLECFELDEDTTKLITANQVFNQLIEECEELRQEYNRLIVSNDKDWQIVAKRYWRAIIQLLPSSWLQTRTVTLNYAVLNNIYRARKNHKLMEWYMFCDWITTLPYAQDLIIGTCDGGNK